MMLPDVIGHENQSQHYQNHRCLCIDLFGRITTPDRFPYYIGAITNPVRNSQTSRFVSVPDQNPERSSQGDSVVLRLQSVMMAAVWWCRSRTGIGYLRVLFSVVNGK